MQLGDNQLMGPGGAATAAALYTLAGLGAYLVIVSWSWRRCAVSGRGRCARGSVEAFAALILLGSSRCCCTCPSRDERMALHGPGGLLGQWLGEVVASFIGVVGAALAGATMLFVSLLLLSAIRMHEVVVVLAWGAAAGAPRDLDRAARRRTGHAGDVPREGRPRRGA